MVPRPLQKLGGNSIFYCVHSGNSAKDCQFNSYVSYVLNKGSFNIFLHTYHMVRLSLNLDWWWVGRWKAPFGPKSFEVHPTNSQCVPLPMIGFEYVDDLPSIHEGPLRPSVGIMAHLVMSDLLIYPFSLWKPPTLRQILDPIKRGYPLYISCLFNHILW